MVDYAKISNCGCTNINLESHFSVILKSTHIYAYVYIFYCIAFICTFHMSCICTKHIPYKEKRRLGQDHRFVIKTEHAVGHQQDFL